MIGSIDHFVDQQILLWQEERRIRERKGVEGNVQRPTICISRQYGARGAAMGRMVADRLGFRFYSDELIHDIAEAAHVRQQVVESLDERVQDGIAEWVAGLIKRVSADLPVLLVEHDIDRVFALADRVTVMNEGKVLVDGTAADARESQAVREIYIGSGTAALAAKPRGDAERAGAPLILDLEKVDAFYGKSHIVMGASLKVHENEIVALLGRNGAGKSTLLKTILGIVTAQGGRVLLSGNDLAGRSAAANARSGIGYVPQGRGLFAGMSVRHNLELGRLKRRKGEGVAWSDAKILEFFPRLRARLDTPADFLSGGEQQMVAVARALSGHVRVLLLDEPFEGLAPAVVEELFEAFDRLRQELSIVIVEHNLDLVLALADQAYVLERGSVVHHGPAAALRDDLQLRRRVLWM